MNGPLGRSLSWRSLRRLRHLVVRDADSAERLHGWGLHHAVVGADPVIALEPEPVEPTDTICVILRPANRRSLQTAAGKAKRATSQTAVIHRIARSIDEAAAATGLRPRFVAFLASRDGPLHEALASRLAAPAATVATTLYNIVTGKQSAAAWWSSCDTTSPWPRFLHSRPAVRLPSKTLVF